MTQAGRVCTCSGRMCPPWVFQPLLGPCLVIGSLEGGTMWQGWPGSGGKGVGVRRALWRLEAARTLGFDMGWEWA